jgi:carbonic anhydrase
MDARLHPEKALGIDIGDSHMIRNAGGRVSDDALRSLAISQQLLGTNEVYIIHHTDCGMLTFTNDVIRGIIKDKLDADTTDIDFLPFLETLEKSVIEDVDTVVKSPLINPGTPVVGLIYDVRSGKVQVVATGETPVAVK